MNTTIINKSKTIAILARIILIFGLVFPSLLTELPQAVTAQVLLPLDHPRNLSPRVLGDMANFAQQGTPSSPRMRLRSIPPSARLQSAVARLQKADPSASFTWLRGHVDAFSAHPKPSVPGYARQILEKSGISTVPVVQPKEMLTHPLTSGNKREGVPSETGGASSRENVGFDGPDDQGIAPGEKIITLQDKPENPAETVWYEQQGQNAVKEIFTAFLMANNDVFELTPSLLNNNLPNLTLVKYGVGKYFRRAEFEQSVDSIPLLDGKTLILFDLNWNVIGISRQLVTRQKLGMERTQPIDQTQADMIALNALEGQKDKQKENLTIVASKVGIDVVRGILAWQVDIVDSQEHEEFTVTLDTTSGNVLNISNNTMRFEDAQVLRWDYGDGDLKEAIQVINAGIYTHDDNTLVHDFFFLVNDDRNDGGSGVCTDTTPDSSTTPGAYGTTTSNEYIRPTRRSDRNFTLWGPSAPKGSFGESHVYYWAREYMQWQKQALIDLGVLTTGNFNNYTKVLIVVNACESNAGFFTTAYPVSTLDDLGENLSAIVLPEACRAGNPNCATNPNTYKDGNSGNLYTFEDGGGYHFPGVIHHELNHFILTEYFGVHSRLDCGIRKEVQYFHEGGLGRTLPQMFWHHYYGVGYLPDTTNKLFRSDGVSGRPHDPAAPSSLNEIAAFACADGANDPYSWGGVVSQPMWEIYQGQKVDGVNIVSMGKPAQDLGMIKSMYFAADMTSASTFPDRFELANRFMEFWELFSSAQSTTKTDWCEVWEHHGMQTFIDGNFCS